MPWPFSSWRRGKGAAAAPPPSGVLELLESPAWQKLNSASQPVKGGILEKLEMIERAGLPPMQVIAADMLEKLGRFPANREGHAVDARDVLRGGAYANVMLFSHRWLRPEEGHPDDEAGTKLATLLEFVRWYRAKYPARALFFWIDHSCIAWDDRERGIAALPAYVAASTDMLCFETPDYDDRAWCRLERAVAYAFMFSGAVPWVIRPGFAAADPPQDVLRRDVALQDPAEGAVTVAADMEHIKRLLGISRRSRASEAWGMKRELRFGGECGTVITAAELQPRD